VPQLEPELAAGLLEHAAELVLLPGPAREEVLRRAISAAYYGMFHALAWYAALIVAGAAAGEDWAHVYRAIDHDTAKKGCNRVSGSSDYTVVVRRFAVAFVTLQTEREKADYSPVYRPTLVDARTLVLLASQAVQDLVRADALDRRRLCAQVLFKKRG
jgi:uncharacterized protein (UPF0332 family)